MFNKQLKALSVQEKQQLRDKLLNELQAKEVVRDTVTLSHAQQRLWVVQQRNSCDFLYNVPIVVALPADLDIEVLQEALHSVLQDNPVLFSAFTFQNECIVQHQIACDIPLETIKLSEDLPDVFEVTSTSSLASFFLQAFDLEKAPLFRMAVLKTPHQRFLLGCFHHLIIDGWSVSLLMKRLQEQCMWIAAKKERQVSLAQDYFAYIAWEKTQSVSEVQQNYWRSRFQQKSLVVDLVTDFPRKLENKSLGQTLHRKIPSIALQHMAQQASLSLNQFVLFAFQFMLARYSGQNDIAVGMPISGRTQARWQETIGLFVNTCIHTTHIEYSRTVHEQLQMLKEALLADLAHAELPFDVVVKSLYEEKLLNQTMLFNILYNFISIQQCDHEDQKRWPMHYCTLPVSKFDLSLHVYAAESHLDLFLEFNTDLFDVRTIKQMLRYLLTVLKALPHHFEQSLKQLSLTCFNQMQQECDDES